jgi:Zn-dependent protease with chaperone function
MATLDSSRNSRSYLQKRNQKLYEQMRQPGALKPRLTVSKILAFALALVIHGVTVYFVWSFLWNLANGFFSIASSTRGMAVLYFGAAIVAFLAAWFLRPRLGRLPENVLDRDKFPAIYALADEVAQKLHAKPIDGIQITLDFNASYARLGLRQKTLLTLGLPLLAVLDSPERIALVVHELAHNVNGDFSEGFVLHSAYLSVIRWHNFAVTFFQPGQRFSFNIVVVPIWIVASILMASLRRLLMHESRRAEYLADILAAQVAGTEAELSVLKKLQFSGTYKSFLNYTRHGSPMNEVFKRFQEYVPVVMGDAKMLSDIERSVEIHETHYAFTHPLTGLRSSFIAAQSRFEPGFALSTDQAAKLAAEIDSLIQGL